MTYPGALVHTYSTDAIHRQSALAAQRAIGILIAALAASGRRTIRIFVLAGQGISFTFL
jgi:hypothetical protein